MQELSELQHAHDASVRQVELLQRECDTLRAELRQASLLRTELAAAKEELAAAREDARAAAVQARLKNERGTMEAEEQARLTAELNSRIQTLQIQRDGLQHRLDLASIATPRTVWSSTNINVGGSSRSHDTPPMTAPAPTVPMEQEIIRDLRAANSRLETHVAHVEAVRKTLMEELEARGKAEVEAARIHAQEKEKLRSDMQVRMLQVKFCFKRKVLAIVSQVSLFCLEHYLCRPRFERWKHHYRRQQVRQLLPRRMKPLVCTNYFQRQQNCAKKLLLCGQLQLEKQNIIVAFLLKTRTSWPQQD